MDIGPSFAVFCMKLLISSLMFACLFRDELVTGFLCFFQVADDLTLHDFMGGVPPIVLTPDMQRNSAMFSPWLRADNKQPFIVVGPEGCGKG